MNKKPQIKLPEGQRLSIIPLQRPGKKNVTLMTTYPVTSELMQDMAQYVSKVEAETPPDVWAKLHEDYLRKSGKKETSRKSS